MRRPTFVFFAGIGAAVFAPAAFGATLPTGATLQDRTGAPRPESRVLPITRLSTVSPTELRQLPANTTFSRYVVGQGVVDGGVSGGPVGEVVYRNDTGSIVFPLTPNVQVADDIRTICAGADISAIEIMVDGGGGGPFSVEFGLFTGCPSNGGVPIPGTQAVANFPNGNAYTALLDLSATPVTVPGAFWIGVKSPNAGVGWAGFGGTPDIGTSEDVFDELFPCTTNFGGCPPGGPACANGSATIYATDCVEVFLAYRANVLSAFFVPLALDEIFADDILPVHAPEPCQIAQVRADLAGLDGQYSMAFEVFSDDEVNLRPLAPVPGTQFGCQGVGNGIVDECIAEFSPVAPVPTSLLWLVYDVDGNQAGPALVGDFPQIGFSDDCFSIFGDPDADVWSQCQWFFGGCPQATVGNPCGTFQNLVYCAGEEPTVACCDVINNPGSPDCIDEVPITQCFGRRVTNTTCGEAQFDPPCGHASCCLTDDTCVNSGEAECASLGGLRQPGQFCGVGNQFCPPAACILSTNVDCTVPSPDFTPGCQDGLCCALICEIDNFCCVAAWDESCAANADANCPLPPPDECVEAIEIACDDFGYLDNTFATDRLLDPGFSCHNGGNGQNGIGSVWAKFTATDTSARLYTCDSPGQADDSLVAIYTGGCGDLEEIGCSDDVPGCASTDFNSDFCINGLVPGTEYIIQVAAWTENDRGRYKLNIDCPATCEAPPNDTCEGAEIVGNGIFPYSTGGAVTDGPALPTGPQPNGCDEGDGLDFQHDIWFRYTATETGTATADLCTGTGFDSRMAVYSGCACPVTTQQTIECNDDSACGINGPSRLTFAITQGQCYTIRVGGHGDVSGTGLLVMSSEGTGTGPNCPPGSVTFTNPQNNTVDARQPNPVNSPTPAQGISTITVTAPSGADTECWKMCETASAGTPNAIQNVVGNGNTYTITLARPITKGAVTRVSYNPEGAPAVVATFTSHPANVNGDSQSAPTDILRIIDCLNNVTPAVNCPWGTYSTDIDQSGAFNPADVLRVIDLLNGADVFDPWNNTALPGGTCTP